MRRVLPPLGSGTQGDSYGPLGVVGSTESTSTSEALSHPTLLPLIYGPGQVPERDRRSDVGWDWEGVVPTSDSPYRVHDSLFSHSVDTGHTDTVQGYRP